MIGFKYILSASESDLYYEDILYVTGEMLQSYIVIIVNQKTKSAITRLIDKRYFNLGFWTEKGVNYSIEEPVNIGHAGLQKELKNLSFS